MSDKKRLSSRAQQVMEVSEIVASANGYDEVGLEDIAVAVKIVEAQMEKKKEFFEKKK